MPRRIEHAALASRTQAARIVGFLEREPRTVRALSKALGMHQTTVGEYLRVMHGTQSRIVAWPRHVPGRKRDYPTAVWGAGPGEDAPKPPAKLPGEVIHEYYVRKTTDPEAYPKAERRRKMRTQDAQIKRMLNGMTATSDPFKSMVTAALLAGKP